RPAWERRAFLFFARSQRKETKERTATHRACAGKRCGQIREAYSCCFIRCFPYLAACFLMAFFEGCYVSRRLLRLLLPDMLSAYADVGRVIHLSVTKVRHTARKRK